MKAELRSFVLQALMLICAAIVDGTVDTRYESS